MAAIYSNGGNRWNILGFNFTKRDALSSVYKISMVAASSIGKGGSGAGGALELHPLRHQDIISITRACNVFKECGPMITSILRKFLQFKTLLIFIPTCIPSNKLSGF
jgi:hypothetical protein